MSWPGFRYTILLRLPGRVGTWEADGAGSVASGPRVFFGEEEDTVGDIAPSGNGAQCGGAVESTVDAIAVVTTHRPWHCAGIRLPIGTNQFPDLTHVSPFILRTM
jgi:hypothetical protein